MIAGKIDRMRRFFLLSTCFAVAAAAAHAQGRPRNWLTYGGDAQHSNWEPADTLITKDNAKDLRLLFKLKLENQPRTARALMPPIVLGNLISYRGFKELAFVAANSGVVYAVDTDLARVFWTKHLEYASLDPPVYGTSAACPGGLTATPAMPSPPPRGRGPAVPPATGAPGARGAEAPERARGPFEAFGQPSVYAISSDGRLHRLNTSTGDDVAEPVQVLPSNATISNLNLADNILYAVTSHSCNDAPNAVWAVDLKENPPKAASFPLRADAGFGGVAVGGDGTVYVQTLTKLLALTPKDLQLKQEFDLPGTSAEGASPMVFTLGDREVVMTAGKDGRLGLVDAGAASGTADTTAVAANITGMATWQEMDGPRWVLASVAGALRPSLDVPVKNGPAGAGSIVAFTVEDQNGKAVLTPKWVSPDIPSPAPPVVANGVVFAVSGGSRATLYALDAATGRELYSSRNLVTTPAAGSGLTVANGRAYFSTADGTFYAFGIYLEH